MEEKLKELFGEYEKMVKSGKLNETNTMIVGTQLMIIKCLILIKDKL